MEEKPMAKRTLPMILAVLILMILIPMQAQAAGNEETAYFIALTSDIEYLKINEDLQKMIQEEMVRSIKWKINSNPDAVNKMNRLKELTEYDNLYEKDR